MFDNILRTSVGPFNIYCIGNLDLLEESMASHRYAVAGSRKTSATNMWWTIDQVKKLDPDEHVLVSGLALGADKTAHLAALKYGVRQIAVLPSGINNIAPRAHTKLAHDIIEANGCLVSLLPPEKGPTRSSYINRNELIAYLGRLLIIPQCSIHSGTMHTVRFAQKLNKIIFVNDVAAPGNQYIINNYHLALRG